MPTAKRSVNLTPVQWWEILRHCRVLDPLDATNAMLTLAAMGGDENAHASR